MVCGPQLLSLLLRFLLTDLPLPDVYLVANQHHKALVVLILNKQTAPVVDLPEGLL